MNPSASCATERPPPESGRLLSLDAYRGLIMSALLCGAVFHSLKGYSAWNWLYEQNEHSEWEGCTVWDLIQPSFMFMVGVAMPFAFERRGQQGDSRSKQWRHTFIRTFNLLAIGLFLDHFGAGEIQIGFIRVLQQIAIGYMLAFFAVGKSIRAQAAYAAAILAVYQIVWMHNPWNGAGGPWAKGNENLGSAFDQWMLGRHYSGYYVGLNAIPATATILFGVMAGTFLKNKPSPRAACRTLLIAGAGGVILGTLLGAWFPLIKRIWTPSFAVYAGGWTTLMLLAFYWLVEVRGWRKGITPLVAVGSNSIAAYVLGNCFGGWFRSATGAWIGWLKPVLGSMGFPIFQNVLFAAFAVGILCWLHRRRIYFKA